MEHIIAGVRTGPLEPHEDHRGSFTEVFAAQWPTGVSPMQWSMVRSHAGALRGMHLHLRHDEYLTVISGSLWVGLHDLRPGSTTLGASQLIRLSGDAPTYLAWPRGLVHGWVAESDVTHLQAVSESYADYSADDNQGCRWDDPELGLDWPVPPRIISDRSEGFGTLSDLRAAVARHEAPIATSDLEASVP
ncbi:MAG: dTDP-4-dehydrorhamnose 3,5-epimerase family protein [Aquihabitans sp.]